MPVELRMLQMDQTMTKGKIGKWLISEGDTVTEGQPLLEIETDKVVHEQESPADGVIAQLCAEEGSNVPVNALLAVIAAPGEKVERVEVEADIVSEQPKPDKAAKPRTTQQTPKKTESQTPSQTTEHIKVSPAAQQLAEKLNIDLTHVKPSGPGGRILESDVHRYIEARGPSPSIATRLKASPLARRLAKEFGLDLTTIDGSGPDGRIVRDDVLHASKEITTSVLQPEPIIELTGIRKIIADRMTMSLQTNASVTLHTEVDATQLGELRTLFNDELQKRDISITYTDLIVKITAKALQEHPRLNATLIDEGIQMLTDINIGVAVALEDGLVVPVIRNADQIGLAEISEQVKTLAEKARNNQLTPGELQGGTFTLTNLGNFGVDTFTPIINPPECAILGVGRIVKKPAVYNDEITIRNIMTLSLTFDHRIVDGAPAAHFLQTVSKYINNPYLLLV
ncbi:2-oxo acid dehydrogenase subunit E2 [Candidatus Poribacteria bacterium]|nr:2-oxo acid dehydrogenase subunit E2 [Candidatus Poribacteria bacterium]MYF56127.1 2-oxo acid dehydrogenase subunit E2 [Candidatus Poribacteria bacterium]MYI93650.1 2-oxo acid dehydrogenase subunit E2 [Candidatus Poribacteria bacterium]